MIASLRNLGPKSAQMLHQAGVTTVEALQALGAVKAYLLVLRSGIKPSLNLLWALEGALTDRAWQEVAKTDKLNLLLLLEQEQAAQAASTEP